MSLSSWIDSQIREAQERGEFDNLAGAGKPLKGIDQPDDLWWVKQLLVREEISYLPPALALRLEAEKFRAGLATVPSEVAVRQATQELNERIRDLNRKPGIDGPPSTLMPLDVEAVVVEWRAVRPPVVAATPPVGVDGEYEDDGHRGSRRRLRLRLRRRH
jgi:hypothetical protein